MMRELGVGSLALQEWISSTSPKEEDVLKKGFSFESFSSAEKN